MGRQGICNGLSGDVGLEYEGGVYFLFRVSAAAKANAGLAPANVTKGYKTYSVVCNRWGRKYASPLPRPACR